LIEMECDSEKDLAMLVLSDGKNQRQCWPVSQAELVLGRDPGCDIVLADRQVSRRHAVIRRVAGEYVIADCQSKNGTFVNGRQCQDECILRDGDEVQIAWCFKLTFVAPDATTPLFLSKDVPLGSARLSLDSQGRRVWIAGRELTPPLSLAQYRLLESLYFGDGRVFTRDEIIETVWPEALEAGVSEQAIDALARRLRERLAEIDSGHQYIVTVRGHGFRLDNPANT